MSKTRPHVWPSFLPSCLGLSFPWARPSARKHSLPDKVSLAARAASELARSCSDGLCCLHRPLLQPPQLPRKVIPEEVPEKPHTTAVDDCFLQSLTHSKEGSSTAELERKVLCAPHSYSQHILARPPLSRSGASTCQAQVQMEVTW